MDDYEKIEKDLQKQYEVSHVMSVVSLSPNKALTVCTYMYSMCTVCLSVCMSVCMQAYVEKYKNLHFLEQQLSELNRSEQDRLEVSEECMPGEACI